MGSNRDRAILSLDVSTAARAGELLGIRGADVDWGEQLMRVVRKGTRAQQWLPERPDSLVCLRLYLDDEALWWYAGPTPPWSPTGRCTICATPARCAWVITPVQNFLNQPRPPTTATPAPAMIRPIWPCC